MENDFLKCVGTLLIQNLVVRWKLNCLEKVVTVRIHTYQRLVQFKLYLGRRHIPLVQGF